MSRARSRLTADERLAGGSTSLFTASRTPHGGLFGQCTISQRRPARIDEFGADGGPTPIAGPPRVESARFRGG